MGGVGEEKMYLNDFLLCANKHWRKDVFMLLLGVSSKISVKHDEAMEMGGWRMWVCVCVWEEKGYVGENFPGSIFISSCCSAVHWIALSLYDVFCAKNLSPIAR